ncbi:MAG: penicillin-binding transpeptidase domain-containing protein, partial [Longimicrobiales bacterium]
MDSPIKLALDDRRSWEPKNYDGSYAGAMTMRDALVYSKNVPTVRLGLDVGVDRVVHMAHQIGLGGRIPHVPSVILGAAEVTPLDLTAAYATFATMGHHPTPRLVTRVVDREGNTVWSQEPIVRSVLDPAVAYLVTNMMQDVIDRGTGTAVRAVGYQGSAAGKTGTTNDAADVWFIGFTPDLVGTVWIGFDHRKTVLRGATGGELAAPLWGRIMNRTGEASRGWAMPPGVEMRQVDGAGNVLAEHCPAPGPSYTEYFVTGTTPLASCWVDPYTYGDTLGVGTDTLSANDERWWSRLRRRLFGRDSLSDPAVDSVIPDTMRPRLLGRPVSPGRQREWQDAWRRRMGMD